MTENNIKVGGLVTCDSGHGLSFHNYKVVDILDNGYIKAELSEPIRYIMARKHQVELQNERDKEGKLK